MRKAWLVVGAFAWVMSYVVCAVLAFLLIFAAPADAHTVSLGPRPAGSTWQVQDQISGCTYIQTGGQFYSVAFAHGSVNTAMSGAYDCLIRAKVICHDGHGNIYGSAWTTWTYNTSANNAIMFGCAYFGAEFQVRDVFNNYYSQHVYRTSVLG